MPKPRFQPRKTIEQVDVTGKRVLMRVDFNVPLDAEGRITDDRRIRLSLPSIRSVINRGGRLILMSHLGRPAGKGPEPEFSLQPAAERLRELLDGPPVKLAEGDCAGPRAATGIAALGGGEVLVLENLRFNPGEKSGDPAFARTLAGYGDVYCNEAFGSAHRADASMVAVPQAMRGRPKVAGLLLERELRFLCGALLNPRRPFAAVLGGVKVSDKLGVLANLIGTVDTVLVGGAMAYTFMAALGHRTGTSLIERDRIDDARKTLDAAAAGTTRLILPQDHVCGKAISGPTPVEVFVGEIKDGWMGLDIGPATRKQYAGAVAKAGTIFWNGPMGVFETPPFDAGTRAVAEAAAAAGAGGAIAIVGGGDTAAAVEAFGLEGFSHVSTGGGASLAVLEGGPLESVELLDRAPTPGRMPGSPGGAGSNPAPEAQLRGRRPSN